MSWGTQSIEQLMSPTLDAAEGFSRVFEAKARNNGKEQGHTGAHLVREDDIAAFQKLDIVPITRRSSVPLTFLALRLSDGAIVCLARAKIVFK